jgi:hypothetical protein
MSLPKVQTLTGWLSLCVEHYADYWRFKPPFDGAPNGYTDREKLDSKLTRTAPLPQFDCRPFQRIGDSSGSLLQRLANGYLGPKTVREEPGCDDE